MKSFLTFLFWICILSAAPAAETPKRCSICGVALGASYFNFTSPAYVDKMPACEACSKLKEHCAICRLPVPATARKLDDGRLFCERDFRAGVFDVNEARRTFEEVRRDVAGILAGYGILPERNITVTTASGAELRKLQQTLPSDHDGEGLLGLTRTEFSGHKAIRHQVNLITGLPRNRLSAVCAHEYTHAWLHENLAPERKLEKDTVEGFCELIAYKLMVQRKEDLQKRIILENAYTRGQINAFVEAENQFNFHRIVKWVQTGVDEALFQTNKERALTLRIDDEPAAAVWPPPAAVPTKVPNALMLKGISGTASRRFALINDATLMKNEEGKVRVGSSNVIVRCLDIRAASVLIQIRGAAKPTELAISESVNQ
jgi:hypothetical protein